MQFHGCFVLLLQCFLPQSLPALWRHAPELVPGAYAVGVVGALACLVALRQGHRREAHLLLLALILLSLGVAVIQVRGGIFACFIALFPLSDACTRLRLRMQAQPRNPLRAAAFIGLTAASVPFLWALESSSLTAATPSSTSRCITCSRGNVRGLRYMTSVRRPWS